ncbi:CDP-diacylglycerol--glycerol-3-phosphate 3-phosphatidyltransferase, mitochondrial [Pectinophora gossypiella]|nr:CDP-diacylglycerol--glycerol-3-phosphate 3-phosphatidyltransferase, mitochondrial [Pectinophora gossypiella]
MLINGNMPLWFRPAELHHFNWLFSVAPCFAVHSSKINIITDPRIFYDTLCERFRKADKRISVASLYIGTGILERRLLDITKETVHTKNLKFNVLLDYQRGTRGEENSRTLLQDFLDEMPTQCIVSLYQTPRLQGSWSKALPSRYNELVGLQHMKLYIADDTVLLSGANCSTDYFQQRQDRYIEIEDPDIADFYSELIEEVSAFSKKCERGGSVKGFQRKLTKDMMMNVVNMRMRDFTEKWKAQQGSNYYKVFGDLNKDTWVFPLIQMGEFGIRQDEQATLSLLSSAPEGSCIRLATGYFNLTEQYASALLKDCNANVSLLMAHPNANGFLGAAGPAGGIPHAYSLIAQQFKKKIEDLDQSERIRMFEYQRPGWTFHAKGLWYYPPGSNVPWGTIVGSANLGERSVRRDLEAQAVIFTSSPELQMRLHDECAELHKYGTECNKELQERQVPLWVRATVGLFRTYF